MQSKAIKLTGVTVVASAVGFLLRWLQNLNIIDAETGLAEKAPISTVLVLYMIIVVLAMVCYVVYLRKYDIATAELTAFAGRTPVYTAALFVIAALLFVSGVVQIMHTGNSLWPGMYRFGGFATVLGAVGVFVIATSGKNKENANRNCRIGICLLLLFGIVWLVSAYKDAATEPVLWKFAPEIVGICAVLIAFYYLAGYYFNTPHPVYAAFFCEVGAFFSFMVAIDDVPAAAALRFVAVAVLLFVWGFVLLQNIEKLEVEPEPDETA